VDAVRALVKVREFEARIRFPMSPGFTVWGAVSGGNQGLQADLYGQARADVGEAVQYLRKLDLKKCRPNNLIWWLLARGGPVRLLRGKGTFPGGTLDGFFCRQAMKTPQPPADKSLG